MGDHLSDREWDRLVELTMLEVECHVLAAEAKVEVDAADDVETRLLILQLPDSRLAQLEAQCRDHAQAEPRVPCTVTDIGYVRYCVDLACYGWRRDYDEWPTFANLTDRLAVDRMISHRAAARQILASVNDPSDRAHLHAIRTNRLAEILTDEDTTLGPWQAGQVDDLRFYVAAEGMRDLMAIHYRDRCWRTEAIA